MNSLWPIALSHSPFLKLHIIQYKNCCRYLIHTKETILKSIKIDRKRDQVLC